MHNKFISFLLGFCGLHKAPGFPFIAAAAAGVLQPDTQVCVSAGLALGSPWPRWDGEWGYASKSVPAPKE